MRSIFAATTALAALAMAAPAMADHHEKVDHSADDASQHASKHALMMVLEDERRAEDKARDIYRHPAQTMAFFQVEPSHTVAEYAPGGGWYTRVIAPYVGVEGKYVGLNFGSGGAVPERLNERLAAFQGDFPTKVVEETGIPAANVSAFIAADLPEASDGTVDRILIIRMMHNLVRWGIADTELMAMRKMLKDDGLVGIVQHQAPEGMAYAKTDGNKGYLQKSDLIALMNLYGFELVDESFINANPNDNADHPSGVWTLPPTLARGDEDREKYTAIGESNRMTLLFKKAD